MPKKPAPRGKVIPLKPKSKPKAKSKPKVQAKKASSRPGLVELRMPPKLDADETAERLRQAMEELAEARRELSRLGHAMTAAHRQIEDNRLSSASAREHLRSELNAVRTDLKTALAEAEIARADRERVAVHGQRRVHELEEALARLRSEVAELRATATASAAPLAAPPKTGGGSHEEPS